MSDKQESELYDIIQGFQMFSSDNNGIINPNEIKEIMEIMNMDKQNPFIYNVINQLCTYCNKNNKEGIGPNDFISLLDQELDNTSINGLQNIYTALSSPSTNTISLQNISNIYKNMNNDDKINNIFSKLEINWKEINYKEFIEFMKKEEDNKGKNRNEENDKKRKIIEENNKNLKFYKYNYDEENNFIGSNDIKKVEFNFSNNIINNNSNFNSPNKKSNSMNSTEKMENIYNSGNKSIPSIKNEINNNDINEDICNFDNEIYNFNNKSKFRDLEYEDELEEPENEGKKKYRKSRKNHNQNEEENQESKENEIKYYKRYHRRYREIKTNMQDKK